ncbi:hypothetical protein JCM9279_003655 [Rhodotorula babjevae]
MQSLVAYSDSDDDGSSPKRPRQPDAGPSASARPSQPAAHLSAPSPAPTPPALTRIKGAASRGASPLSGVTLPTSSTSSPYGTPNASSKRRGSSSPPAVDRAAPQSTADRNAQRQRADADREQDGVAAVEREERAQRDQAEAERVAAPPDVKLDTLAEFGIPPVPTGPCKPSVQAKLANFHALRQSRNLHFNDSLHASKAFRNPRIYAKLVEFVDVDESGTGWDKEVWDPRGLGEGATAARIAVDQKARSEAKAAQPAGSRSSIAFTSSAAAPSTSSSSALGARADGRNGERDRRDRDRGDRERERERDRERGAGARKGGSRWDRERSRSPRRR